MKISLRILLINFAIVAIIIGSSAFAFYSIVYNVLSSQQSKYLRTSVNDFSYTYRQVLLNSEDEFISVYERSIARGNGFEDAPGKELDFILQSTGPENEITEKWVKDFVYVTDKSFTLDEFIKDNPFILISSFVDQNNRTYHYGRLVTNDFMDELSKRVNAELALIVDNTPITLSNESANQRHIYNLSEAYKSLKGKSSYEILSEGSENSNILAALITPTSLTGENFNFEFLVFTSLDEAAALKESVRDFLLIIGLAGVFLSLILSSLFTEPLRKQITALNKATEITKEGNFQNRIEVRTKDEIGQLASAFNSMLVELEKNQRAKNEYSEFITLINQNPTLKEISDASLRKIIRTCGFTVGALYTVEDDRVTITSSYGLNENENKSGNPMLFEPVLKNQETIEITSSDQLPVVSAGLVSIELKYLLILPIVYHNTVIAILELGGLTLPSDEARDYLSKIQEQLAIGLTNATAFVKMENLVAELKVLNEEYQKQNVQITQQNETLVDLHNELKEKAAELEIQRDRAEESTKVKSQFLASMSHELRTPMNSILGLTELILEKAQLKGKNRERLEVVLKSGKRLMNLINDILDLSKIEAGKMEIKEEDVILQELVEEVEASISPLVMGKDVEFRVTRDINTNVVIRTDKGRVVQVLINLLGNAVKFTERGFVEFNIGSTNESLVFKAIDTGIGLSEQDQKIIFEEFRQVDASTTRKYSGTGLGLAISKRIADLLSGSLSVTSEPGKGSTFSFTVPLKFVEIKDGKDVIEEHPKVNIDILRKNRKNPILVIDDDPEIRYTIGQYLTSKGYEVVYAEDGEQGMEKALMVQPFAITLDVMLPNKDGWTILKELKEHPQTKDIPVILLSIIGDQNLGYGLGAFEYFVKPISADKLLTAFDRLENLANKRLEKIVIVDDDELEFEKFRRAFKNEKIRIDYIQDSELAYSKILEIQPDLIILDLMMPKVDGVTLSHKLKSSKETKHIPIIISTAKDLSDEEKNSLYSIVEEITVKSKGHPLDVLKVVRDRIREHEAYSISRHIHEVVEDDIEEEDEELDMQAEITLPDFNSDVNNKSVVLIVDDDPDTLFTVNEIVQACDCHTLLAKSGKECLNMLQHCSPSLILLDIMMPEMDGFQVLNKIRENSEWAQIPVFAVTAKAMSGDKQVILKAGFDDYIPKPVNPGIIAFKIEKILTKAM